MEEPRPLRLFSDGGGGVRDHFFEHGGAEEAGIRQVRSFAEAHEKILF